jgi:hypothetical protein
MSIKSVTGKVITQHVANEGKAQKAGFRIITFPSHITIFYICKFA